MRTMHIVCDWIGCGMEADITGSSIASAGWGTLEVRAKEGKHAELCPYHLTLVSNYLKPNNDNRPYKKDTE